MKKGATRTAAPGQVEYHAIMATRTKPARHRSIRGTTTPASGSRRRGKYTVVTSGPAGGANETLRAPKRRALEAAQPVFERIEPTLGSYDVGLAQHGGLDRVLGLLRRRRLRQQQRAVALRRDCKATRLRVRSSNAQHSEDITQACVARKRSVLETARSVLVDDERRLELVAHPAALQSVIALQMVARAGTFDVLREGNALKLHLPLPLRGRSQRKVEHLQWMLRRQRLE